MTMHSRRAMMSCWAAALLGTAAGFSASHRHPAALPAALPRRSSSLKLRGSDARRQLVGLRAGRDLSELSREELEALARILLAENAKLTQDAKLLLKPPKDDKKAIDDDSFCFAEAVLAAGFAFESYNEPSGARWERGADGCDVAFSNAGFVRAMYSGALLVRVRKATALAKSKELSEAILTGSRPDPYVNLAVVEAAPMLSKKARAANATDVGRTATMWRMGDKDGDDVEWPDQTFCLYCRDAPSATLSLTVMDDNVGDDTVMGQAELKIGDIFKSKALEKNGRKPGECSAAWRGTAKLTLEDGEKFDGTAGFAAGAVAAGLGLATGGIATLAVAAGAISAMNMAQNRGKLELEVSYCPFSSEEDVAALAEAPSLQISTDIPRLSPAGASPGVDWAQLCALHPGDEGRIICEAKEEAAALEPLCFVDHRDTGTQAGVWRDTKRKRLLISFRGTSEPRDVVTDASAIMTPWCREAKFDEDGYDSVEQGEGDPLVHAGFRGAMDSISRRLKQLVATALMEEDAAEWELIVTGHSLGGALATLFALDIAKSLDVSRALPVRPPKSKPWFLMGQPFAAKKAAETTFGRLSLVTFGSPRVGDVAFAAAVDAAVPRFHRVVNGQDVVARLPRGFSYAHGGRTVLVSESAEDPGLWVEGQDVGDCPLKKADTALGGQLSSPLSKGSFLADLLEEAGDIGSEPLQDIFTDPANLARQFGEFGSKAAAKFGKATPEELATILGVDANYAKTELKLLAAVSSGEAISHHLEPAYFAAIKRAAREVWTQNDDFERLLENKKQDSKELPPGSPEGR